MWLEEVSGFTLDLQGMLLWGWSAYTGYRGGEVRETGMRYWIISGVLSTQQNELCP